MNTNKLVATSALTLTLSPEEMGQSANISGFANSRQANPASRFAGKQEATLPLRGEKARVREVVNSFNLSCTLASRLGVSAVIVLLSFSAALAQSYSIDWYKISGGGGTSTNSQYSVSGTIGQPDAGSPMTGPVTGTNDYSGTGGFWSLYALQTPGAPTLFIAHSGNTVTVYWQNVSGWSLQQNANLALASWSASSGVNTSNGTNSITINNPAGSRFFRLKQ